MRLPELFCGFPRRRLGAPTLYPVACMPQAWASATPYAFLEACLGLRCDFEKHEIRLENPFLPNFLEDLTITNLELAGATTDVTIQSRNGEITATGRRGGDIAVRVVR